MNTSGYSSVTFRGLFAAGNEFGPGSSAYDADDYLKVFYSTNGGVTWENGVWFSYENHGDGFNEPIGLDTDFDGQADVNGSDRLGIVFTEYTFSIPGNPSSVMIHVETHMDSGDEEIAYDNLRIEGTAAVPDPEPSEQPTALTTERTACNGLEVSFTDAGGAQLPAGYLLVASDGVIAAPLTAPTRQMTPTYLTETQSYTSRTDQEVPIVLTDSTRPPTTIFRFGSTPTVARILTT